MGVVARSLEICWLVGYCAPLYSPFPVPNSNLLFSHHPSPLPPCLPFKDVRRAAQLAASPRKQQTPKHRQREISSPRTLPTRRQRRPNPAAPLTPTVLGGGGSGGGRHTERRSRHRRARSGTPGSARRQRGLAALDAVAEARPLRLGFLSPRDPVKALVDGPTTFRVVSASSAARRRSGGDGAGSATDTTVDIDAASQEEVRRELSFSPVHSSSASRLSFEECSFDQSSPLADGSVVGSWRNDPRRKRSRRRRSRRNDSRAGPSLSPISRRTRGGAVSSGEDNRGYAEAQAELSTVLNDSAALRWVVGCDWEGGDVETLDLLTNEFRHVSARSNPSPLAARRPSPRSASADRLPASSPSSLQAEIIRVGLPVLFRFSFALRWLGFVS